MNLPPTVLAEIQRRIHSRDRENARQLLEGCVRDLKPAEREKVLLGIVRIAGRHMDKLIELVDVANTDYRIIEYWHGWPEENRARFLKGEQQDGQS